MTLLHLVSSRSWLVGRNKMAVILRAVEEFRRLHFSAVNVWQPSRRERACSDMSEICILEDLNIIVICARKVLETKLLSRHIVRGTRGSPSHVIDVQRALPLGSLYNITWVNTQDPGCIHVKTAWKDLTIKLIMTVMWGDVSSDL